MQQIVLAFYINVLGLHSINFTPSSATPSSSQVGTKALLCMSIDEQGACGCGVLGFLNEQQARLTEE